MSRREEYLRQKAIQKAINMTTDIILSGLTVALKKEFGFGQERISRVLQAVENEITPIGRGMIGFEDYKAYAEELTKVSINKYTKGDNND